MISDLDDMPDTVRMALEWSTQPRPEDVGKFDEDPELADRLRSVTAAVVDCELMDNEQILVDLLMVLGSVPPMVHAPLLLSLAKKSPEAVNGAFRKLAGGAEAQRFAYRSLIETLGRFSRHGLVIDVMGDEELIEDVRTALERARGRQ